MIRLAIIVSHPIQYYAPLYTRLARRDDLAIKVFFTWHAGEAPVFDNGFKAPVAWDIPLTQGYEFERVPNIAADPGTHHFFGLRNPALIQRVEVWRPDVVHITGWSWLSHLQAMHHFRKRISTLFRGDSHLLDDKQSGLRWRVKCALLKRIFFWPTGFLVVGTANRAYYEAFGVGPRRLYSCPHSVDVSRFAEPSTLLEQKAVQWRRQLGISDDRRVLLFAGKFERKKQPLQLMQAVQMLADRKLLLLMVGNGELKAEVDALAATDPDLFRVLPMQNQSRMPVVYRLAELFVLPSAFGETWGLAVNEAMACGRPVLVSSCVGCAQDMVDASCGRVFSVADPSALPEAIGEMMQDRNALSQMGAAASVRARSFDLAQTEAGLFAALARMPAT
jgi:glycosyltransferase involved in cell wall biosynthesis